MKPAIIVADSSPLIALAVMELFPVLPNLFELIYVPTAVVKECVADVTKPKAHTIQNALKNGQLIEAPIHYVRHKGLVVVSKWFPRVALICIDSA